MRRWPMVTLLAALTLVAAACGGDTVGAAECDGEIPEGLTVEMFAHEGAEADAITQAVNDFNSTRGASSASRLT